MDVDRDDDDDDDGIAKHSFAIIYLHKTVSYPRQPKYKKGKQLCVPCAVVSACAI